MPYQWLHMQGFILLRLIICKRYSQPMLIGKIYAIKILKGQLMHVNQSSIIVLTRDT